jgi:hypothetical protein
MLLAIRVARLLAIRQLGKEPTPMRTIAVLSQKGGSGKTTLALHLAVAAEQFGKVAAVIDIDPQASAAGWKDSRNSETPVVVSIPAARLAQALEAARNAAADIAVIDSAPTRATWHWPPLKQPISCLYLAVRASSTFAQSELPHAS